MQIEKSYGPNYSRLHDTQKWFTSKINNGIKKLEKNPPNLREYIRETKLELGQMASCEWNEIIKEAEKKRIIYVDDYHPSWSAKNSAKGLLLGLLNAGKKIVLALELININKQEILDAYVGGRISKKQFEREADLFETYKDKWWLISPLLDLAIAYRDRVRVVGIDSQPHGHNNLRQRDKNAARIIKENLKDLPDDWVVCVVMGGHHIYPSHLPAEVEANGHKAKSLIIFQNLEEVYNTLVEHGIEQNADFVRIQDSVYCIISATPAYLKFCYLYDLMRSADCPDGVGDSKIQVTEILDVFLKAYNKFFEFKTKMIKEDNVFVGREERQFFHNQIRKTNRNDYTKQIIIELLKAGQSCVFLCDGEPTPTVYINELTFRSVTETLGLYIRISNLKEYEIPKDPIQRFYNDVMEKAVGFLFSKILNFKKHATAEKDEFKGTKTEQCVDYYKIRRAETLGKYMENEQLLLDGSSNFLSTLRNRSQLIRSIGYRTGDAIFSLFINGTFSISKLKEFVLYPPSEAITTYKEFLKYNHGSYEL